MTGAELKGAAVLVVGMARSGVASAELLAAKGARVAATDSKALEELGEAAERLKALGVRFERQNDAVFAGADLIVVSPGVPADLPGLEAARRRGQRVIGEVELASWFLEGPVLGVTGSNGKTTTTALAGHLLAACGIAAQVGGNIGLPATAMVASSRPGQWNVLELSSFQLETIERFRAQIGVALNVTDDHMDRHYTMERYAAAKERLFENQQAGDWAVLNADDRWTRGYAERARGGVEWFSLRGPVERGWWVADGALWCRGERALAAAEVPLRGLHNVENTLAAAAAAHLAGGDLEGIARGARSFPGVEHRLEYVLEARGVRFYNDSKATNVDATLKALEAFDGGLWVILGGRDKGGDFRPLREALAKKAKAALLIGEAAGKMAVQLAGAVRIEGAETLEQAMRSAFREAAPGDTILLAPACASFDQFSNYEHRGRVFKELAAGLAAAQQRERQEVSEG